jgi:hypothetical protein
MLFAFSSTLSANRITANAIKSPAESLRQQSQEG